MHAVGCQALTQSVYKIADLTTSSRVYHTPTPDQLGDELEMLQRMSELLKARRDAVEEEAIRTHHFGQVCSELDHQGKVRQETLHRGRRVDRDADRRIGDRGKDCHTGGASAAQR